MSEQVLTDAEVKALINERWWYSKYSDEGEVSLARAVERAVLAKCVHIKSVYGESRLTGYVTEADARERELRGKREAYALGYLDCATLLPRYDDDHMTRGRDARYPSLNPKTPPVLKLSTGEWTRDEDGVFKGQWTDALLVYKHAPVATASDASALAAWLREWGSEEERK